MLYVFETLCLQINYVSKHRYMLILGGFFCASILFTFSMGFTPHNAKQPLLGMDLQGERKRRGT